MSPSSTTGRNSGSAGQSPAFSWGHVRVPGGWWVGGGQGRRKGHGDLVHGSRHSLKWLATHCLSRPSAGPAGSVALPGGSPEHGGKPGCAPKDPSQESPHTVPPLWTQKTLRNWPQILWIHGTSETSSTAAQPWAGSGQ